MSDQTSESAAQTERATAEQRPASAPTKAAQVLKLLARSRGATLTDLSTATGWQPHTMRAHLTRLRKAGHTLERLERKAGPEAYHLVNKPNVSKSTGSTSDGAAGNA